MAKKKSKKVGAGHHSRSRHAKNAMGFHRRHRRRNPFPESASGSAKLISGAALALLGSVYIPGWILSFFGGADTGLVSYFLAAVVAFGPAYALQMYPQFAKGWLAGGGAGFVWRIIDDLTGGKYLSIGPGTGMGSFIINGKPYVLPAQSVFSPYARGRGAQALLPAATTTGPAIAGAATPMAVAGGATQGMGWVYQA